MYMYTRKNICTRYIPYVCMCTTPFVVIEDAALLRNFLP
jgi:hypothetical protein